METVPASILTRLLNAADHAPSVFGTKPWQWLVAEQGVELHADTARQLEITDPTRRDLTISCGAALYSLEAAAAAQGWRARIRRLPDAQSQNLLARVRFEPHTPGADDLARAEALVTRRIDRRSGASWPIPPARITQTSSLGHARGVLAVPLESQEDRALLLDLLAEAALVQQRDQRFAYELELWGEHRRPVDPSDLDAAWLVLATTSDDTLCWLRTGEALQAVWLWATRNGFSLVPHSQPIEVTPVRARLQEELFDDCMCPQLVVRLGWATVDRAEPPTDAAPASTQNPQGSESATDEDA